MLLALYNPIVSSPENPELCAHQRAHLLPQATTSVLSGLSEVTLMRWIPSRSGLDKISGAVVTPGRGTYCCRKAQDSASRKLVSYSAHSISRPQVCSSSCGHSQLSETGNPCHRLLYRASKGLCANTHCRPLMCNSS